MAFDFFVHIIESPSDYDLLNGITLGRSLSEAFNIADIPYIYNLASNKEMFIEALHQRLVIALKDQNFNKKYFVLHLSMHGNKDGVELTNKYFLKWDELYELILPLKIYMNGNLIICMSSCEGFYGALMDMNLDGEQPLGALVGNTHKVYYHDAAIAYITFYHLFFKGKHISECVEAMKIASGDDNFDYRLGVDLKRLTWECIRSSGNAGLFEY
ncbi:hypothetical protein H6G36_08535 [Anabaena minutissima FACHB-250]|nr:hypothetical protein [Anabaena minutissima FACHB-250]